MHSIEMDANNEKQKFLDSLNEESDGTKCEMLSAYSPSLEEAQKFVEGFVEMVYLRDSQLLVNEEGLLKGLAVNERASLKAQRVIVGNALILKGQAMWR